jgi:uncharacterized protein with HEPN domain
MSARSIPSALMDMVEAIGRIRSVLGDMSLDEFESDWQRQWLIERGIEIISEASRRLPEELKERHPEIPWRKVSGIGNILRHEYGNISPPVEADYRTVARMSGAFTTGLSRGTACAATSGATGARRVGPGYRADFVRGHWRAAVGAHPGYVATLLSPRRFNRSTHWRKRAASAVR